LLAPDEGRNAEVGREMQASGAWLVPTYNGVDYLDKPAFYFKTVALSLALFGKNETAARIPSAVFGVALVLLVFGFCRKVYGVRCGLLAAIIVATTPLFLINARTVIFDIALAFFVCGAIFAGYLAETVEGPARRRWYALGAASAGFATLVKGPVGFLIPTLVLLVFHRIDGRRSVWKRFFAPLNVLVFFGVTLPWFIGLCIAHADFFHYGLVEESFHRFTTAKRFHRSEPFYFYLLIVACTFFPWSFLLPEAGLATWKLRWAKHPVDRLCIVWSVLVVLFFSVSQSKLPGYILSVTVACGILFARLVEAALDAPTGKPAYVLVRATRAFSLLAFAAILVILIGSAQIDHLAKPLRMTVEDLHQLGQGTLPLTLLLAGFGVLSLLASYRRNVSFCFLCLTGFAPLLMHLNVRLLDVVFEAKSGRRIAAQISSLPGKPELACLECFPNGLPFYLGRTATLISRDGHELTSNYIISSLERGSRWPQQIVSVADFQAWLESRKSSVYLILREEDKDRAVSIAAARGARLQPLGSRLLGLQIPAREGL
jgi:4-amino-4-deoxy-L-arabinose transferase-like glycosyltransferase